jgi:hypothetical protein
MQHREGGNHSVVPASIPAQVCHAGSGGWKLQRCACQYSTQGCHAASGGWKLSRDACQHPSTSAPCSIGRVEIMPLRLPVSQHKGAMQDREGGNYPAAPATIPAQGCHAASRGRTLSRCACQYPSTGVPCRIGRVAMVPVHLPVSQHKGAMQDREGGNYPAALASIPIQVFHAASGG